MKPGILYLTTGIFFVIFDISVWFILPHPSHLMYGLANMFIYPGVIFTLMGLERMFIDDAVVPDASCTVDFSYRNQRGIFGKDKKLGMTCFIDKDFAGRDQVKLFDVWDCDIVSRHEGYYIVKPISKADPD